MAMELFLILTELGWNDPMANVLIVKS